jgi:hypothetical protein
MTEPIDPNNPVARLCAEGVAAETSGDLSTARDRYESAWRLRSDAYEAAIAAHFLARAQRDLQERHHWNAVALRSADAAGDERVASFYPSLHLNMGRSCEDIGDLVGALRHYRLARERLDSLSDTPYAAAVRRGIESAEHRMTRQEPTSSAGAPSPSRAAPSQAAHDPRRD